MKLSRKEAERYLTEIDAAECEESLYSFLSSSWRHIDPVPFTHGWPIEAIAEHLQAVRDGEIRRLIINIPPRCSKSSTVSVAFPAWIWAQSKKTAVSGPGVQFLCASYATRLSTRDSVKCRRLIASPWYRSRWGDRFTLLGDQNAKMRFGNDKGGERLITSVESGITGEGGSIIIVDDPNDAGDVTSAATIERTIEWWDGTMPTRLNDSKTGAFIIIQQRIAEDDLTGHIMAKTRGEWTHLCLPMHYEPKLSFQTSIGWTDPRTEEGELLWPERFGEAEVKALEVELGPWRAAGQLEQRPEPRGGGIIKREWWLKHEDEYFPQFDFIVASIDTAYTEKTQNDYSAMTVWGIFTGDSVAHANAAMVATGARTDTAIRAYAKLSPKVMLMYAWQERLELHDLVTRIGSVAAKFQVDRLLIENKASGHSVTQELRRLFGSHKFDIQLIDPKGQDKVSRLYSVQHLFAEGLIYAPDRTWADMVIDQVGQFPRGKHDDLCLTGDTLVLMGDGSSKRIDTIIAGDVVKTPKGPATVSAAAYTGERDIWRVDWNTGHLTGTHNHPVMANGVWKELASLCPYDTLETSYQYGGMSWGFRKKAKSRLKPLFSTAERITDTLIRLINRISGILPAPAAGYTGTYGSSITGRYQKDIKYTTSTGIPETTPSKTLRASHSKSTEQSTIASTLRAEDPTRSESIWKKSENLPKRGTPAMKDENGIGRTHISRSEHQEHQNLIAKVGMKARACGAEKSSYAKVLGKLRALLPVKQRNLGITEVLDVFRINTTLPVYNITVEKHNCYYANGVLVHNCDTVSQGIRHIRDSNLLVRQPEYTEEVESSMMYGSHAPPPLYPA